MPSEPPAVVGDLDDDREVVRLGTGRSYPVHLPGMDTCQVLPTDHARRRRAKEECDDRRICGDCRKGEPAARTELSAESGDLKP
jgi:hypothetical protein